jgi:hypothetical protein
MNAEEYVKEARTRPNEFYKKQLKRARATAVVLGSSTVLSLIFLVYGFIQKEKTQRVEQELVSVKRQLAECQTTSK